MSDRPGREDEQMTGVARGAPPDEARTLAIDVGGTGLKAAVLDATGAMISERVRVPTPHPCPPDLLVGVLSDLVAPLPSYGRVSVGFPGMVRRSGGRRGGGGRVCG